MLRRAIVLAVVTAVLASAGLSAQGRITPRGRAITEYRGDDVLAVVSYEYSQKQHDTAWLLIEFAVQAKQRIAIDRKELTLIGPGEQTFPLATQAEFLADHEVINLLLQNAAVWRRPFDPYFSSRPTKNTIRFVGRPGALVNDSVVTNLDEVATGDLFFKSPNGKWEAGTYRLVLNHEKAKADLPITLE